MDNGFKNTSGQTPGFTAPTTSPADDTLDRIEAALGVLSNGLSAASSNLNSSASKLDSMLNTANDMANSMASSQRNKQAVEVDFTKLENKLDELAKSIGSIKPSGTVSTDAEADKNLDKVLGVLGSLSNSLSKPKEQPTVMPPDVISGGGTVGSVFGRRKTRAEEREDAGVDITGTLGESESEKQNKAKKTDDRRSSRKSRSSRGLKSGVSALTEGLGLLTAAVVILPPFIIGAFLGIANWLEKHFPEFFVGFFKDMSRLLQGDMSAIMSIFERGVMAAGDTLYKILNSLGMNLGSFGETVRNAGEQILKYLDKLGIIDYDDELITNQGSKGYKDYMEGKQELSKMGGRGEQLTELAHVVRDQAIVEHGKNADEYDLTESSSYANRLISELGIVLDKKEKALFNKTLDGLILKTASDMETLGFDEASKLQKEAYDRQEKTKSSRGSREGSTEGIRKRIESSVGQEIENDIRKELSNISKSSDKVFYDEKKTDAQRIDELQKRLDALDAVTKDTANVAPTRREALYSRGEEVKKNIEAMVDWIKKDIESISTKNSQVTKPVDTTQKEENSKAIFENTQANIENRKATERLIDVMLRNSETVAKNTEVKETQPAQSSGGGSSGYSPDKNHSRISAFSTPKMQVV